MSERTQRAAQASSWATAAVVFAKFPYEGRVKTRMVPPLRAQDAAALHVASLRAVCEGLTGVIAGRTIVAVTPDGCVSAMRALLARHPPGVKEITDFWPQGEGDLGARLGRAVDRAFASGADPVVLLGADSPTLPAAYLREALTRLEAHDAVLGPCEDGGYYLLGVKRPLPRLFTGIDWGGPDVAVQTRRRAEAESLDLVELPVWYDLDRVDDLGRAWKDLSARNESLPPAAQALFELIDGLFRERDGR